MSHCGGDHLETWEDGTSAQYGRTDLDRTGCKAVCALHPGCLGFVFRLVDGACLWRDGTLSPENENGEDCYLKGSTTVHTATDCGSHTCSSVQIKIPGVERSTVCHSFDDCNDKCCQDRRPSILGLRSASCEVEDDVVALYRGEVHGQPCSIGRDECWLPARLKSLQRHADPRLWVNGRARIRWNWQELPPSLGIQVPNSRPEEVRRKFGPSYPPPKPPLDWDEEELPITHVRSIDPSRTASSTSTGLPQRLDSCGIPPDPQVRGERWNHDGSFGLHALSWS